MTDIANDPKIRALIASALREKYRTVEDFRGTTMGDLDKMLRSEVYDSARERLGVAATGKNRQRFASALKTVAAERLVGMYDDQPIAVIKTGEGQRHYLYDYVEYGPNPHGRGGTPLYAATQITDAMYGQPYWMRDLVADLNARSPRLPWQTLKVSHGHGSRHYRIVSPELQSRPKPERQVPAQELPESPKIERRKPETQDKPKVAQR